MTETGEKMKTWEEIYRQEGIVQHEPSMQIAGLVPLFKEEGVKKILDFGCGTGRHTAYLARQGFYVVGIDDSEAAIKKAEELVAGLNNVELIKSDISRIPYEDGYFDAAICIHVIQHMTGKHRRRAISALERTLGEEGLLFLRTISTTHPLYGRGEQIEPHTFIDIPDSLDGKMPHHYFSEEELRERFSKFQILELKHNVFEPKPDDIFKYGLHEWAMLARKVS